MSDDALLKTLGSWGAAELMRVRNRSGLERLPLAAMLSSILSFHQRTDLDHLAPSHITLPSGTRAAIDYTGPQPVLAVKLQELFGQTETPRIAGGRVPLLCHLLTPASRPLAVTQDLRSFWVNAYPGLRTQMKAKYARHVWPEDPLASAPVKGGRKRR